MKIHPLIATGLITAAFALQGWTLYSVTALQMQVAVIETRINFIQQNSRIASSSNKDNASNYERRTN